MLIYTSHRIKMTDTKEHIKQFKNNFSVVGIAGVRNNMSQQECIVLVITRKYGIKYYINKI
jgi:hypothetical protein